MAPRGINRPGYSSSPTGINRPGYSSPKPPTNVNRPGTSSPNFSGYKRPEKDNKPQPQPVQSNFASSFSPGAKKQYYNQLGAGPAPLQDIQNITQRYNRAADIPGYQAKMRDYQAFQQAQANDGIARLTQGPFAGQQILSMREPQLTAMAPTFGQFMGDVGGAAGDMLGGVAKIPGQMLEAYQQVSPLSFILDQIKNAYGAGKDVAQGIGNFFKGESQYQPIQAPGSIPTQQEIQSDPTRGMSPGQINLFYNLTGTGMNPDMARQQVLMRYASGGIATLH